MRLLSKLHSILFAGAVLAASAGPPRPAEAQSPAVTTYHNDTNRTGWNNAETALTTASVGGGTFGELYAVMLDDQVDGQPLFVPAMTMPDGSVHDVVYVTTENNTVYALDAPSGAILNLVNLGPPAPSRKLLPGNCNNRSNIGIGSTPVISLARNAIYVVSDTYQNGIAAYQIHKLDLATLQDQVPPVIVTASAMLRDGTSYTFDPVHSRQRPALLLANNIVYAGFGSFCDVNTRGWVLDWNADTLLPLSTQLLLNHNPAAIPPQLNLTAIWMSGYGLASADDSNIYFATGNTQSGTYDANYDLAESFVAMTPDLSQVIGYFTPYNEAGLDKIDEDLGSGGLLPLPAIPNLPGRALAVGGGKQGALYLVDRGNMGGYNPGGANHILEQHNQLPCWCGPSYYVGADGLGRLVSSGGMKVMQWRFTGATKPYMHKDFETIVDPAQSQGFFTSVSSNGTAAASAVIWAALRPSTTYPTEITLMALDPTTGKVIYTSAAGTWLNIGSNPNVAPTIANGRVFVASQGLLTAFGLGGTPVISPFAALESGRVETAGRAAKVPLPAGEHIVYGWVRAVHDRMLTLVKRHGTELQVDIAHLKAGNAAVASRSATISVTGRYERDGIFVASFVAHAHHAVALWGPDQ